MQTLKDYERRLRSDKKEKEISSRRKESTKIHKENIDFLI